MRIRRRIATTFCLANTLWIAAAHASQNQHNTVDHWFDTWVIGPLSQLIFFDIFFWDDTLGGQPNPEAVTFPLVVGWLALGAIFLTFRMGMIQIHALRHAIEVVSGAYDHPDHPGEVTHFQALSSALSGTVGLGNIAGVAVAISLGGPGAIFWLIVSAFFGMTSKFTEVTLGLLYRKIDARGVVSGGPMHYLGEGFKNAGHPVFGRFLAVTFALMCIGGSLGGGNMFQANQSYVAIADWVPFFDRHPIVFGCALALTVGVVIIGGIRRIGRTAEMIVPVMCILYLAAGTVVLVANAAQVPAAFGQIITQAFTPTAGFGGMMGVLATGFQRASFSNEAGVGSASIAHSAASTDEPVREGIVALLAPLIDTIIVCTMTGLVIVVSDVYHDKSGVEGILLTSRAFATVMPNFPIVLSISVLLFAFSTMVSWSYYGERCATYLWGDSVSLPFRIFYCVCTVLGCVLDLKSVIGFSDLMILGMAFPNMLGLVWLSTQVRHALDHYMTRLRAGEFARNQG